MGFPNPPVIANIVQEGFDVNSNGDLVYLAQLVGSGVNNSNDGVIYSTAWASPGTVVREGDSVPNLPGLTLGTLGAEGNVARDNDYFPQIDDLGRVAFQATLRGAGVTASNERAIFVANNQSAPSLIVRANDQAPGYPTGTRITGFPIHPRLANDGGFSFIGNVSSGTNCIWVWGPNGLTKHLGSGDQAPGFPPGHTIQVVNEISRVGDNGHVLVVGLVAPGDRTAIWVGTAGSPRLAFADGMRVTGLPAGAIVEVDDQVELNGAGELLLKVVIYPGVGPREEGVLAWSALRGPRLIARRGRQVTVDGVGLRTFRDFTLGGESLVLEPVAGATGKSAGSLDDNGSVAFVAEFTTAPFTALVTTNIRAAGRVPGFFGVESPVNLLWQQTGTVNGGAPGQVFNWFRNSSGNLEGRYVGFVGDTNWSVVGSGDFDNDGVLDLVWHNTATGEAALWLMNANAAGLKALRFLGATPAGQAWRCRVVNDVDTNGVPDLVWQNETTGVVGLWLMTTSGSGGSIAFQTTWLGVWAPPDSASLPWRVVGAADFDGDYVSDLLFRYEGNTVPTIQGSMGVLTLRGGTITNWFGIAGVADLSWQVAGTADMNADGQQDILWRNMTSGQFAYWPMNGFRNTGYVPVTVLPTGWTLVRASDVRSFNGPTGGQ